MKKERKKLKLFHKIFIGLGLGIIVGLGLSQIGLENTMVAKVMPILTLVGDLFLRLIRMVIVPLVFFSIMGGVCNQTDLGKLKTIGVKSLVLFFSTAAIAITIGLIVAQVLKPGEGLILGEISNTVEVQELPGFSETILNIIPTNPVQALAEGEMLQIISFSIFLGAGLIMVGEKAKPVINIIDVCSQVMYKVTDMVIGLTPYGVFALMGKATATYGTEIFGPVLKFIFADYLANFLVIILVYVPILMFLAKVHPIKFFKKVLEPWLIAFSTCATSAALPVSMKVAREKVGVPDEIASFVLPLGATINMNGTAIFFGLVVMFVSQIYGLDMGFDQQILLVLTAAMLSVGCAAVPQSGLVIGIALLTSMNLPLDGIALIAGIYRVIDQAHTSNNALGDLVVATTVAALEGDLNRDIFNADNEALNK